MNHEEHHLDCRCFVDGCEEPAEPGQDDLCRTCQDHWDGTRCHLHEPRKEDHYPSD